MNRSAQHAFEPEEVMAYLDGELAPARAAELAAHLQRCEDCQIIASQLRRVSEQLLHFEIESPTFTLNEAALAESKKSRPERAPKKSPRWRLAFRNPYVRVLAAAAVVVLAVRIGLVGTRNELRKAALSPTVASSSFLHRISPNSNLPAQMGRPPVFGQPSKAQQQFDQADNLENPQTPQPEPTDSGPIAAPEPSGPMIAQTAALTILANNYDQAIASIEPLVNAQSGYVQKLDAQAETGSSRQLSATLRVPANQLGALLNALRKLGHIEQETQANEEVTDQYVDLQARLKSAHASEQRMLQLLATRTGKLEDVLDAERELARIREEIESMEGQRILLAHRVDYATVDIQIREEYRKELGSEAPSTKTQIHNAAVEGFENLQEGAVSLLLFLLNYGLSIIFWSALIGVPAWLIARAIRARASKDV